MSRRTNEIARGTEEELTFFVPDMSHEELSMLEKNLNEYNKHLNTYRSCAFEVIGGHPDYRYYWWPRAVFNEEIPNSLAAAARKYWTPVPESELPLMANSSNQAFKGARSSFIENGNSILHKRHKKFDELELRHLYKEISRVRESISVATGFSHRTPGKVTNSNFETETYSIRN